MASRRSPRGRAAGGDGIFARMAQDHGPQLIEQAIKGLVAATVVQQEVAAEGEERKPSLSHRLVSAALVRLATRSVPGAILVGGGLIAKALHDRHRAKAARG